MADRIAACPGTAAALFSPTELNAILGNLIANLAEHAYQLSDTSKRARNRCRDGGHATSREDVNFVLKGIVLAGHKLGEEPGSSEQLAQCLLNSVLELCRREQLVLDAGQTSQVVAWSSRAAA